MIRKGTRHVLSKQNANGGWGNVNEEDLCLRYQRLARHCMARRGVEFSRIKIAVRAMNPRAACLRLQALMAVCAELRTRIVSPSKINASDL